MPTWIALLRAVNVAGHGRVAMADLCAVAAGLGYANPRSVLQTGNLVFDARGNPATMERQLETEAAARLGLQTDFFVRTSGEWRDIVGGNPFRREEKDDPSHLVVTVLKTAPSEAAVRTLRAAFVGRERIVVGGRHLYITYPDGIGRSRLTGSLIEKTLGTRGTARNWNTVARLAALAGA